MWFFSRNVFFPFLAELCNLIQRSKDVTDVLERSKHQLHLCCVQGDIPGAPSECVSFLKAAPVTIFIFTTFKTQGCSAPTHTVRISTVEHLAAKLSDYSQRMTKTVNVVKKPAEQQCSVCTNHGVENGLRSFQGSHCSEQTFRRTGPGPNTSRRQKLFLRDELIALHQMKFLTYCCSLTTGNR